MKFQTNYFKLSLERLIVLLDRSYQFFLSACCSVNFERTVFVGGNTSGVLMIGIDGRLCIATGPGFCMVMGNGIRRNM